MKNILGSNNVEKSKENLNTKSNIGIDKILENSEKINALRNFLIETMKLGEEY